MECLFAGVESIFYLACYLECLFAAVECLVTAMKLLNKVDLMNSVIDLIADNSKENCLTDCYLAVLFPVRSPILS